MSRIFNWSIDTPVDQIINEALGAASMCWEHIELAGVFDSTRALQVSGELTEILKEKLWINE
jgi:hypothetical protein